MGPICLPISEERSKVADEIKQDWVFVRRSPMSKQRDPIQGEFFNTESITAPADKLVREAIQNTLDAGADEPARVRVRIYVSGHGGAVSPEQAAPFFEGMWAHVGACHAEAAQLREEPCRYLVFEDFGTTGLVGDPASYDEPPADERNDFFYFFRAEGKSGKSGADRGRWGLGKYVFPDASGINTFFGLTVSDNGSSVASGPLLMGQAVLENHKLEGESYEPDGWWSLIADEVPLPISDSDSIEKFRSVWNATRSNDEPGLSVIVPYVKAELEMSDITRSVVRDYFVAVLSRSLTVDIDSGEGQGSVHIDADCLDSVVDTLSDPKEREETRGKAALAKWALGLESDDFVKVNLPQGSPGWTPDLIDDVGRSRIQTALTAGDPVAVRVSVSVKRQKDSTPSAAHFDVLFCAGDAGNNKPFFVREGIIVSEVKSRQLAGIRCMVLVREGALADMLGDAEGVAHINWSARTERFKREKYQYGEAWLSFIRASPAKILDIVRGADDEVNLTLASEFFSTPESGAGDEGSCDR